MNTYIKIVDGSPEPYTLQQLRQQHPNTSFPDEPSEELLEEWNVFKLERTPKPSYNANTHSVSPAPAKQINGVWKQQWQINKLPSSVAKSRAEENRANAYKEEADPLFFKWQRGEATEAEWLGKVEEIRARYPYPKD